nr:hypothetical protein [uncultured Rhodopila sp.]
MASVAVSGADQPEDDVDAVVRAAREKLARTILVANLGGDPLGSVMEALDADLGARHLMHTAAMRQAGQTKPPPASALTPDQVHTIGRHLVMGYAAWAGRFAKVMEWRIAAILACTHLAVLLLGMAVAHWGIDTNMRGMQCGYNAGQWMCWAPAPTKR